MVETLATRKQSEAIRAEMRRIRTELPYDVDAARVQVRQMTDWKYQLHQHAVPILGAAVLLGYLLVPSKGSSRTVYVNSNGSEPEIELKAAKRGIVSGLVATTASMVLRSGTSLIAGYVSQHLLSSFKPADRQASQRDEADTSDYAAATEASNAGNAP